MRAALILSFFVVVPLVVACGGEEFVSTGGASAGQGGSGQAGAGQGGSGQGAGQAGQGGSGQGGQPGAGKGGSPAGAPGEGGASGTPAGTAGAAGESAGGNAAGGEGGTGQGGAGAGQGGETSAGAGGDPAAGGAGGDSGAGGQPGAGAGGQPGAGAGGAASGGAAQGGAGSGQGGADPAGAGGAGAGGNPAAGSGGAAAGAGGNGAGSSQGGAGSGQSGGQGGGGAAGVPCAAGDNNCGDGEYCRADTGTCSPCGDMNRFTFERPEFIEIGTNLSERSFPRVSYFGDELRMALRAKQGGSSYDIVRLSPPYNSAQPEPCCINKPADDSGPLVLPSKITAAQLSFIPNINASQKSATNQELPPGVSPRYFFLDSARGYQNFGTPLLLEGFRRIYVAGWINETNATSGGYYYYETISRLNTGVNDYSVAYAFDASPPRFFWMSERKSGDLPKLFTLRSSDAPDLLKEVPLSIPECGTPQLEDLAPWVFPNGNHLLFHARCKEGDPMKLYRVSLKNDGQASGDATEIPFAESGDLVDKSFRTPSLSPDRCEMFFEIDNQIHRARRR